MNEHGGRQLDSDDSLCSLTPLLLSLKMWTGNLEDSKWLLLEPDKISFSKHSILSRLTAILLIRVHATTACVYYRPCNHARTKCGWNNLQQPSRQQNHANRTMLAESVCEPRHLPEHHDVAQALLTMALRRACDSPMQQ